MREIKVDANRFKSSAAEQIDNHNFTEHEHEDVNEDIIDHELIIKQESMFKEETPSNEQSQ